MNSRNTIQRQVVFNAVRELKNHPTSEEVYNYIRPSFPSISLGTVYRNLNMLSDLNEIRKISTNDNAVRFDYVVENHYHFQCKKCSAILDVFLPNDTVVEKDVLKEYDFRVDSCDVLLKGICVNCLKDI